MGIDISKIEAIVFDLGGVIINLYEERTYEAFAELGSMPVEEVKEKALTEKYFKDYETGHIDDPTFRAHLRESLRFEGQDEFLDEAWNAMLGAIPKAKLELLDKLRSKYKLFVMSNTNTIHVRRFLKICDYVSPEKDFYGYFDKVYLSNEVGARKPDARAWQVILDEQPISVEGMIFIDDKLVNIQAASELGFQVYHNRQPDDWMKFFE